MNAIYCAQLVDKNKLEEEFLIPVSLKFQDENFNEVVDTFFEYSKGDEFFIKKTEKTLNVLGSKGKNFCTHLLITEDEIEFFIYTCSIFDLKEEDLKKDPGDEKFFFNFSIN